MYKIKAKIENKIDFLMEAIWLLIVFLVPIFFLRNLYNCFEVPKIILFRSLTEVLVFLYIIKLIFYGFPGWQYFKQRLKYFLPAIIFIFFVLFSSIFSKISWFSFFGGWERWLGSFSWLHFLLFSIIIILNLSEKRLKRIIYIIFFSTTLMVIYGILQFLGLGFLKWSYDISETRRIFSTTGQPNFLGSFLLLTLPVFLIVLKSRKKWLKFASVLGFILLLIALILTKSRGAILGFLAMILFFGFFYGWKHNKKISILVLVIIFLFVSFLVYSNLLMEKDLVLKNTFSSRIKSLSNLERVGKYRLMHWGVAFDLILKNPLGYGIATQRFFIPNYYIPEFAIYEAPNIFLDHFHNDLLDMLFSLGWLGFFSYLIFLGYIFILGLKFFFKNKKYSNTILLLLAGILGYLVSILFSFHITSALSVFWAYVAIIIFIIKKKNFKKNQFQFQKSAFKIIIAILLFILTTLVIWHFNGSLFLSSNSLYKANLFRVRGEVNKSIDYHNKAIVFSPNNPFFKLEFANSLYKFVKRLNYPKNNKEIKLHLVNTGINQLEAIPQNLRSVEYFIWMPQLLSEKCRITKKDQVCQRAEQAFKKSSLVVPRVALLYNDWCQLEIYKNDLVKAKIKCQKALDLYPDLGHPYLNKEHQQMVFNESFGAYNKLVQIYKKQDQPKKAIDIAKKMEYRINKAYEQGNSNLVYIYNLLYSLYDQIGNKEKADFYKDKINNFIKFNN